MNKKIKKIIIFLLVIGLYYGQGNMSIAASNDVVICGVNIGISTNTKMIFTNENGTENASGYYYNGKYLGASQCFGFARWCQYKLFGIISLGNVDESYTSASKKGFYKISVNGINDIAAGALTQNNLKLMISAAKPGAHLRTHSTSKSAHSMIITQITDTGFSIAQCNGSNNNEYSSYKSNYVGTYTYTWSSYLNSTYGARGIDYIEMPYSYTLNDMDASNTNTIGNNPEGNIDIITGDLQSVRVAGWAFDRDNVSESIGIHVYIGTDCIGAFMAEDARPDVDNAYACGMYHGFDKMLTVTQTGTQKIDVYAININGGNNVLIGSSTVTIQANTDQSVISNTAGNNPEGNIDIITGDLQSVRVAGWAFDRDNVSEPIGIHVYIGTDCIGAFMAEDARPDVDNAYACGMYHGFDKMLTITQTGTQKIDVYAINIDGGNNILIGSSTVTIQADTEQPVISNISVSGESAEGYTISCNVTDNTEVDYVTVYTWTNEGGQDDLTSVNATKDGNMYTCIINSSEHLGRSGIYVNHIYAYDKYGNCSSTAVNAMVYYNSHGYDDTEIKNDTDNSGTIEYTQEPDANDKQTEQENVVLKPTDLRINPIKKTIQIRKSFTLQITQRYPKEWTAYSSKEWAEIYEKNIEKVVYKSSKSSIASVNKKTGRVTGKKRGNTTIKTIIYFNSGKIAVYKTKVYVKK